MLPGAGKTRGAPSPVRARRPETQPVAGKNHWGKAIIAASRVSVDGKMGEIRSPQQAFPWIK